MATDYNPISHLAQPRGVYGNPLPLQHPLTALFQTYFPEHPLFHPNSSGPRFPVDQALFITPRDDLVNPVTVTPQVSFPDHTHPLDDTAQQSTNALRMRRGREPLRHSPVKSSPLARAPTRTTDHRPPLDITQEAIESVPFFSWPYVSPIQASLNTSHPSSPSNGLSFSINETDRETDPKKQMENANIQNALRARCNGRYVGAPTALFVDQGAGFLDLSSINMTAKKLVIRIELRAPVIRLESKDQIIIGPSRLSLPTEPSKRIIYANDQLRIATSNLIILDPQTFFLHLPPTCSIECQHIFLCDSNNTGPISSSDLNVYLSTIQTHLPNAQIKVLTKGELSALTGVAF